MVVFVSNASSAPPHPQATAGISEHFPRLDIRDVTVIICQTLPYKALGAPVGTAESNK